MSMQNLNDAHSQVFLRGHDMPVIKFPHSYHASSCDGEGDGRLLRVSFIPQLDIYLLSRDRCARYQYPTAVYTSPRVKWALFTIKAMPRLSSSGTSSLNGDLLFYED